MEEFNNLPDERLVLNIKQNNEFADSSINILLNRHGGLYSNIVNSISTGSANQVLNEDKYYILYKAADTYNPSKNVKFSTWFGNTTRWHALNYINREDKERFEVPLDSLSFNSNEYTYETKVFTGEQQEDIFNKLKQLGDERIEKIYKLKFLDDKTMKEISKEMEIPLPSCYYFYNKGKKLVRKMIENNSYTQ